MKTYPVSATCFSSKKKKEKEKTLTRRRFLLPSRAAICPLRYGELYSHSPQTRPYIFGFEGTPFNLHRYMNHLENPTLEELSLRQYIYSALTCGKKEIQGIWYTWGLIVNHIWNALTVMPVTCSKMFLTWLITFLISLYTTVSDLVIFFFLYAFLCCLFESVISSSRHFL